MTMIQEQAIQLIKQLPDDKIKAIITLAADEIKLIQLEKTEKSEKKKNALYALENPELDLPDGFDSDEELAKALEEKYGIDDFKLSEIPIISPRALIELLHDKKS